MPKQQPKIRCEPEADVLGYKLNEEPIDYAEEVGNFVVHFSQENLPVLVEILNAKEFLHTSESIVRKLSVRSPKLVASR